MIKKRKNTKKIRKRKKRIKKRRSKYVINTFELHINEFFHRKEDSEEEGEVKDIHPLVTVTDINPEDIPDVPFNKFLMRGPQENKNDKDSDKKLKRKQDDFRTGGLRERSRRDWGENNHGFRRDRRDKSGRIIKGRGKFVSI